MTMTNSVVPEFSTNVRNAKYDNLKGLLIFLVVFGHSLFQFVALEFLGLILYLIIYSFHMPAFIFLLGKFTKPSFKRIKHFAILYLIFQSVFTVVLRWFCNENVEISLFKPQYTLWFLLASIAYVLLAFVLPKTLCARSKAFLFVLSFMCAILVGFVPWIGESFALSQIFAFLPFFLAGTFGYLARPIKPVTAVLCLISAIGLLGVYIVLSKGNLSTLYMRECYVESNSAWYLRVLVMLIAFMLIRFLVTIVPNKKIPILTDMGKHTLFIFLGHSMIVKYLANVYNPSHPLLFSFLFSILLTAALWGMALLVQKIKNYFKRRQL